MHTLDIAPLRSESPPQKRSGMERVLKGFHSFTCTPTRSTYQFNISVNGYLPSLVAGKVTVGLASHWSRVADISGSPPTGSRPGRGR